ASDTSPTPPPFASSNTARSLDGPIPPQLHPLPAQNPTPSVSSRSSIPGAGFQDAAVSSTPVPPSQILGRRQRAEPEEEEEGAAQINITGIPASHSNGKRRRRGSMPAELDKGEPSSRAPRVVSNGSRAGGDHPLAGSG